MRNQAFQEAMEIYTNDTLNPCVFISEADQSQSHDIYQV